MLNPPNTVDDYSFKVQAPAHAVVRTQVYLMLHLAVWLSDLVHEP